MINYKNIVCTGPESSGKSTLVKAIANHFDLPHLNEYARTYLNEIDRSYLREDVEIIGRTQMKLEKDITRIYPMSILDTDALTIEIWMREKYGMTSGLDLDVEGKFYLLLYPDLPWEEDPLRENPDDRERLFHLYEKLLIEKNAPFLTVKNTDDGRIKSVIEFLKSQILFR